MCPLGPVGATNLFVSILKNGFFSRFISTSTGFDAMPTSWVIWSILAESFWASFTFEVKRLLINSDLKSMMFGIW